MKNGITNIPEISSVLTLFLARSNSVSTVKQSSYNIGLPLRAKRLIFINMFSKKYIEVEY